MRTRRWGDNDRYVGPFTYARDLRWKPLGIVLQSGDDETPRECSLRFSGFGHTLIISLPPILRPWRRWVDTSKYEWSKNPAGGYWDIHAREFGFSYSEGFLQVFLGPQTGDSETTKSWNKFLPWTQWRHVRRSFYGLHGEHIASCYDEASKLSGIARFDVQQRVEESCPKATFAFLDYDGEALTATTHLEEREWHFGTGWFRWLSAFRKPKLHRSLDIKFSGETGDRKGSWKGGTVGHSIETLDAELHESAFRRYCAEHKMTFVGTIDNG